MRVERPADAATFLRDAGPYLVEREAQHCVMLGIAGNVIRAELDMPPDGYFGIIRDDADVVVGAAVMTPPWQLALSHIDERHLPDAAIALAADVAESQSSAALHGVIRPTPVAEAVAAAWCQPRDLVSERNLDELVYKIERLIEPAPVPGAARLATIDDRDLLVDFVAAFHAEAMGGTARQNAEAGVDRALIRGERSYWLWEVDGVAVSTAASAGPTPNGIRIGPVFTPKEFRGRGFASAVTAAVTRTELAVPGRRFVFLFTDVTNPTSNKIYQALGYERVGEMIRVMFSPR